MLHTTTHIFPHAEDAIQVRDLSDVGKGRITLELDGGNLVIFSPRNPHDAVRFWTNLHNVTAQALTLALNAQKEMMLSA